MLFVPSYLDYVRLRSFLRAEEVEFEGLSEYADGGEVARGRSRFAKGETRLALYTELCGGHLPMQVVPPSFHPEAARLLQVMVVVYGPEWQNIMPLET